MKTIEIKANFKKLAVADRCELTFVLVPSYAHMQPALSEMVGASVFVTLDDEQMSMQADEMTEEPDYDQPQLPERVADVDAIVEDFEDGEDGR